MSEHTVLVAEFRNLIEAELARNRLETEGIPAFLVDTSTAGVFSGMGIVLVKLYVPETDQKRARAILACPGADAVMLRLTGDFPLPADTPPDWLYCPACGSEVSTEFDECTSCGTAVGDGEDFSFGNGEA
jgi:hypothetical protein